MKITTAILIIIAFAGILKIGMSIGDEDDGATKYDYSSLGELGSDPLKNSMPTPVVDATDPKPFFYLDNQTGTEVCDIVRPYGWNGIIDSEERNNIIERMAERFGGDEKKNRKELEGYATLATKNFCHDDYVLLVSDYIDKIKSGSEEYWASNGEPTDGTGPRLLEQTIAVEIR